MNGKQFMMATLFAVSLLTISFIPISSQQAGSYDPWVDINEDGKIDIRDLVIIAKRFGTYGTPINKTALLETLENQLGRLPAPDLDSGWVSIDPTQFLTFSHNLGTSELFAYLLGKNESGAIHQLTHEMNGVQIVNLDDFNITVWRHGLDRFWHQVRVMIWKIGEPTQSKSWHYVTGFTLTFDERNSSLFHIQGEKWRIRWEQITTSSWPGFIIWDENGFAIEGVQLNMILGEHHDAKGIHYVYEGKASFKIESIPGPSVNFTIESYH